jgi:hypothetical protein
MPTGFVIVDSGTVRGPDGQKYGVLDAIEALRWTPQLCPLMRHEYTIWKKPDGPEWPEWAWNVLSAMLLARNPDSFRAYYRGYPNANRYWDAPDGLRYWRSRFEIDRGQPDGVGQRRVSDGGKRGNAWDGPRHAPSGIGLYDEAENGGWWPTYAALAAGYLPCRSCAQTSRRAAIVASPKDPHRAAQFIAAAASERGRPLTREELTEVLLQHEADTEASPRPENHGQMVRVSPPADASVGGEAAEGGSSTSTISKAHVVRRLLEIRSHEAPLGYSSYRGVLTQKAIAEVAGVPIGEVTKAALEMDRLAKEGRIPQGDAGD